MTSPGDAEILAGVSSAAVQRATGKTWAEWLAILDAVGARQMAHPDIALYLSREQGVPDWWCQMVTVGYEQARGLRAVHQKTDGFTANASKTIGVPVARLFAAWTDDGQRAIWLADAPMTIRKATPGRSVRIAWEDSSAVDANFTEKGEAKSMVAIQHARLPDAAASTEMKAYWSAALKRLAEYLTH
jgi:uncharacterized protein YndB with AHSA1/START domain